MKEHSTVKFRQFNKYTEKIMASSKIHILEKPDGIIFVFKITDGETIKEKQAEIMTRPRKGVTADIIKRAASIIKRHPCFTSMFDSVPLNEYYVHAVFYGGVFSEDADYAKESFGVLFLDVLDHKSKSFKLGGYDMTQKFFGDTGMGTKGIYSAELPMLYSGPPDLKKIEKLGNDSKLTINGIGTGAYIICEPLYHQQTGEILAFEK